MSSMDHKPGRPKTNTNIISFLPTRSSFAVRYHPHSPGGAETSAAKMKNLHSRGFSGPLVPMEARRKERNSTGGDDGGFGKEEPTSPQVSCIGQIKHKKKAAAAAAAAARSKNPPPVDKHEKKDTSKKKKKKLTSSTSVIHRIFGRKARVTPPEEDDVARGAHVKDKYPAAPVRAPSLGQMKRFTSGRETLGSFDWKKVERMREKAAEDDYDDDDNGGYNCCSDEEEEDVIIPHSAPIIVGGGGLVAVEPKKDQVNLWKRRTFAPAVAPLHLS